MSDIIVFSWFEDGCIIARVKREEDTAFYPCTDLKEKRTGMTGLLLCF